MTRETRETPRQEAVNAAIGTTPYESTFAKASLNPSALGEIGSRLAITASQELSRRQGYQAGLNPSGTPLPPITEADKAYVDSYLVQSQNTLSLRAYKFMQESQTEINNSPEITPDMLMEYQENIREGLSSILSNSPEQIRGNLEASLGASLISSSSQLTNKMLNQQRVRAKEEAVLATKDDLQNIFKSAKTGEAEAGFNALLSLYNKNSMLLESGLITKSELEASNSSARITFYTGVYSKDVDDAFKENRLDEYLKGFLDNKPKELSYEEFQSVASNVISEAQNLERFQQRYEGTLYSEAERLLAEGSLDENYIKRLQDETKDVRRFNNFMSKVYTNRSSSSSKSAQTAHAISVWGNPDGFSNTSSDAKNSALDEKTQSIIEQAQATGIQISEFDARVQAMMSAAAPVPSFTSLMSVGLTSANPEIMSRNARSYRLLLNSNPKVLDDINPNALAMMTAYELQLESGNKPDRAAAIASEIVQGKTKEQEDVNDAIVRQWERANSTNISSWAKKLTGQPKSVFTNLQEFGFHAKELFKRNLYLLNGDEEGATRMTKEAFDRTWGITEINDKKEYVFAPIEKVVNVQGGFSKSIIKEDIYSQLKEQIEPMKRIYEDGVKNGDRRLSFYYEVQQRPSFEEFMKAQEFLADYRKSLRNPADAKESTLNITQDEINENIKLIKDYNSDIVIKRISDSGEEESFRAAVRARPGLVDTAEGIIDGYDISLKNDNGALAPMLGYYIGPLTEPIYRPNAQEIKNKHATSVSRLTGMPLEEYHEQVLEREQFYRDLRREFFGGEN